jgi:hypothetical protein
MGQAPSIKDMQATETDFDNWVKGRQKVVEVECKAARDALIAAFDKDYDAAKYGDMIVLKDKYFADFTHDESFSLAAIGNVIDKVAAAVLGTPGGESEGGVDATKPTAANLAAAASDLLKVGGNLEALLAVKALNLITGILELFNTNSSLTGKFEQGLDMVSPGLVVGISARRTQYSGQAVFHNTTVIESFFVVLVKYSHTLFGTAQGAIDDINLSITLEKLRERYLDKLTASLENVDPFDDKAMGTLTNSIEAFQTRL